MLSSTEMRLSESTVISMAVDSLLSQAALEVEYWMEKGREDTEIERRIGDRKAENGLRAHCNPLGGSSQQPSGYQKKW